MIDSSNGLVDMAEAGALADLRPFINEDTNSIKEWSGDANLRNTHSMIVSTAVPTRVQGQCDPGGGAYIQT